MFWKIYSGGLGILAGDLKEASDSNVDMWCRFLYRYGILARSLQWMVSRLLTMNHRISVACLLNGNVDENGQPMVADVPYLNYFVHAYMGR